MSSIISIRVNEQEQEILNKASLLYNCGVSSLIKRLVFEKLEDEYDMQIIKDYENKKASNQFETRPIEDLWKELNL